MSNRTTEPRFIVVDLFCGAGGTSTGFAKAKSIFNQDLAYVVAAVNHDHLAVKSHWKNHKQVKHFLEDITLLYGHVKNGTLFMTDHMRELVRLVDIYRAFYPNAKVILWASLECTNFSKAKGGQSRDADSRTLAEHLDRYVGALDPDYVQIENVVEFMSWGPMSAKVVKTEDGAQCCNVRFVEVEEPVFDVDEWGEVFQVMKGKKNKKPVMRKTGKFQTAYDLYPESTKNGRDWLRWREHIKSFGYRDDWRELNSADFGAYTSRNRLFGIFAKEGLPINWPKPTHAKKPSKNSMFGDLKKWKPVRDVLDFSNEGISIFNRKIPLVDPSLERVYAGLIKFVAGGNDAFILKYNSTGQNGKHYPPSIDEPCPTVACQNRLGLVYTTSFLAKYYSGKPAGKVIPVSGPAGTVTTADGQSLVNVQHFLTQNNTGDPDSKIISVDRPARTITAKGGNHQLVNVRPFLMNTNFQNVGKSIDEPAPTLLASRHHPYVVTPQKFLMASNGDYPSAKVFSVNEPCRVITAADNKAIVSPAFLTQYYSTGGQLASIDEPARTLRTKDTIAKIQTSFFDMTYTGHANIGSVDEPAGTLMPNDKHRLVNCEGFILNPSHGGNAHSIEVPSPVIIARQDKAPLYLIQYDLFQEVCVPVYETDSDIMIKIKIFMAVYGISDIKMRMLLVPELLRIQGFPDNYELAGNQTDQKKFIGNAVHPDVVTAWTESLAMVA